MNPNCQKWHKAFGKNGPGTRIIKFALREPTPSNIGNLRGALFEVKNAFRLAQEGEEIVQFGLETEIVNVAGKTVKVDYDIITKALAVECKDISWNFPLEGTRGEKLMLHDVLDYFSDFSKTLKSKGLVQKHG